MINVFKYGKIFDVTLCCFIISLILLGILICNGIGRTTPPEDVTLVTLNNTDFLSTFNYKNAAIKKGEEVRVYGQDMDLDCSRSQF